MPEIKKYNADMQEAVERFFERCFSDLGWDFEPYGEHSDILNIQNVYMKNGCMWCMFEDGRLIGTIAVRTLDAENKCAEFKRLYVLKEYQGRGYGDLLCKTAMNYAREAKFKKIYADTANDRAASQHLLSKYGFVKTSKYAGCSLYTDNFYVLEIL